MFNLFKRKPENFPDFWEGYAALFQEKQPALATEATFTVFDTETTGFDKKQDRILSIGAVKIKKMEIEIASSLEIYVHQERFNPETVEIHGILKNNEQEEKMAEEEAVRKFLEYIGNSVLVAHHAGFDIGMVNAALRRMQLPNLKNTVLDTAHLYKRSRIISNLIDQRKVYSLDEIAAAFTIDVKDRHTAAGDAFITALAFLTIMGRLYGNKDIKLKDLLK